MYIKHFRVGMVVSLLIFIFLQISNQEVFAKNRLEADGSIVAYSFSPPEWQTSFAGITNILVVEVSKVLKGKEKSKFIVVRFVGDRKEYAVSELTKGKIFRFNLERYNSCDTKIDNLMFVKDIDDNSNFIYHRSNLKFVSDDDEQ